jgi:hypothetical protein
MFNVQSARRYIYFLIMTETILSQKGRKRPYHEKIFSERTTQLMFNLSKVLLLLHRHRVLHMTHSTHIILYILVVLYNVYNSNFG